MSITVARDARLEALLGSKVRAALLTLFCTHPSQAFYVRELSRRTRFTLSAVQKELDRLAGLGLLTSEKHGREVYYKVDEKHALFPELKALVYKTAGFGEVLRDALNTLSGVFAAFLYGSVAKGTERTWSDIDLFIVGQPDQTKLASALRKAESRLGREVNLSLMGLDEWRQRRQSKEGFILQVLRSPKIFLVGDERLLRGD